MLHGVLFSWNLVFIYSIYSCKDFITGDRGHRIYLVQRSKPTNTKIIAPPPLEKKRLISPSPDSENGYIPCRRTIALSGTTLVHASGEHGDSLTTLYFVNFLSSETNSGVAETNRRTVTLCKLQPVNRIFRQPSLASQTHSTRIDQ